MRNATDFGDILHGVDATLPGSDLIAEGLRDLASRRLSVHALRLGDVDAYCYTADAMVNSQADMIVDVAMGKKLPTMFQAVESALKGALASYGVSYYYDFGRLSAKHAQRILQGADPGSLPVEQLEKFRFVINLKTARAFGLTIPKFVLARADEVIE